MVEAKFCNSCGYFHDREHAKADRCDYCGTLLAGAHSLTARRLPDRAQYRPENKVYAEADFFTMSATDYPVSTFSVMARIMNRQQKGIAQRERGRLTDAGYRVLTIRYDLTVEEQLAAHQDVFGNGSRSN